VADRTGEPGTLLVVVLTGARVALASPAGLRVLGFGAGLTASAIAGKLAASAMILVAMVTTPVTPVALRWAVRRQPGGGGRQAGEGAGARRP
jgi:hypothetical protein